MNGIKMEGIKQDPGASPGNFMDDDLYEDTGELAIPSSNEFNEYWLARVPDWLLASLDGIGDDEEIEIGKIAIKRGGYKNVGGRVEQVEDTMKIVLNPQGPVKNVPREYNVTAIETARDLMPDTYVFTEKDLPGFNKPAYGRSRLDQGGQGYRVSKPRTKYKKAIPKHTSLLGNPRRILECVPDIEKADTKAFMEARTKMAILGANSRTNINDQLVLNQVDNEKSLRAFKNFVDVGGKRKIRQENKAARIPKNELLDWLHRLFDNYEYWPMKELKKTTSQPEAYLKEVLGEIAALVKSGPFASCWKRNGDLNTNAYSTVHDKPPETKSEDEMGGDDEEDEMEDVV